MIGASAALALSGIPFKGPIGAARVGYSNNEYVLNPSHSALETSRLNMVVAGTESAVLMVESEASELSEDEMLGAVLFAHQEMQVVIQAIQELAREAGKAAWDWQPEDADEALRDAVAGAATEDLGDAYRITDKLERQARVGQLREAVVERFSGGEDARYGADAVADMFANVEKELVRQRVLDGEPRIDGRDRRTVRPIGVEVGLLPKTHGSALFTRGETQAIVTATLGTLRDAALIDALEGSYKDHFMLHYNFPPYSVGEARMMTGPKRREIGHGRLARRGIAAVLPNEEEFPYTLRVVSEITESNGSSSMASVCGSSLALMDAGVPVKAPVAGVAMGLVKQGDKFAVLTDILGDEDHLGDMDFKVAGTPQGVTALQMDIKIDGITEEIMETALEQARDARLHILGEMNKVLAKSRDEISENAPAMTVIKVHPDKIRDVIRQGRRHHTLHCRRDRRRCGHRGRRHRAHLRRQCREQGRGGRQGPGNHGGSGGGPHLQRPGGADRRFRRLHQHPAGQGRPAAHLADRPGTGRNRRRLPRRGADGRRGGPRCGSARPHQAQHEGSGELRPIGLIALAVARPPAAR